MPVNGIGSNKPFKPNEERYIRSGGSLGFASVLNSKINKPKSDLDSIFDAASKKYGVPVNLLKAVAKAESNFNSTATSSCGAMGIMQLMPATAESLGVSDAYNPEQNIMGGAKYLGQLLKEFDGKTELAVAAYNAGPGNVIKYSGIPPFEETQNYVSKVMEYFGSDTGFVSSVINPDSFPQSPGIDLNAGSLADILILKSQMRLLESSKDPKLQ